MRPSAAEKATLRWVFLGPQGIRAGWSLLIFATLMTPLALITSIVRRDYPSLFTGEIAPGISLLIEAVQVFFIVGACGLGLGTILSLRHAAKRTSHARAFVQHSPNGSSSDERRQRRTGGKFTLGTAVRAWAARVFLDPEAFRAIRGGTTTLPATRAEECHQFLSLTIAWRARRVKICCGRQYPSVTIRRL